LSSVVILFVLLPAITIPVGLDVGTEICFLALYAVAFNLLLGYTGIASFGHSIFFGLGSYGIGLIQIYFIHSTSIALILSMVLCVVAALLLGVIVIRRRGVYFSLLMLAFTQMMFTIAWRWKVTGGEMGLQGILKYPITPFDISIDSPRAFYVFAAIISLAGISILWALLQTPYGKTLQGIRENEKRMRLLGCNTFAYKLSALAISGAFAGLAGGLNGLLFHATYAQVFDWMSAGTVLVITLLGGTRYFLGPVVGTLVYVFLQYYLVSHTEHWMIVLGLIFILSILFLPDGIASFYPKMVRRFGKEQFRGEAPYERLASTGAVTEKTVDPKGMTISGLSKRFGAVVVADDLNLVVKPGQLFAVIGPNGAGKTTLFNMISGVLPADKGKICLGDIEIQTKADYQRARMGLSRSFQIVSVFKGLTVFENVRLAVQTHVGKGSCAWGHARKLCEVTARTWTILDRMGLSDKAHVPTEQLSHGDQRLVEIGISIASDPPLLLLDEPLAGLAEADRASVAAMIRGLAPKHTVVLVEHDIDRVLAISDHVAVLHQGHVIASSDPATVASNPEVQRVYLGTRQEGKQTDVSRPGRSRAKNGELLLSVENLMAAYGKSQVLQGVSLAIGPGEIVGLLGRNGVGKTTTVMSIGGVLHPMGGRICFKGREITRNTSDLTRLAGIGIVPQGRRIFTNLSVMENLRVSQIPGKPGRWKEEEILELFPFLKERRNQKGRYLSGGEQQLLAIARSLMAPLDLLILDEPLEGLAPVMASLVEDAIIRLRDEELTILLVEQTANVALRLVDRVYVLNNGQVVYEGNSAELIADTETQQRLLGIHV
jgi:ABC-type branched-subunit amino acid transport system ATPase component/ABC-type branched-subunit amino acid transport system permease subunit